MTTTTTSTEAELLAQYWNNVFINELRGNLVIEQFGLKNIHPKATGNVAWWLAMADLTAAAALSEATDPTEYTLSAARISATVSQYGMSVLVSDILQDTWVAGSYQTMMERLARNAALTIDTVIRNAIFTAGGSAQIAGTAVHYSTIVNNATFDTDMAEIREAVRNLETLKVPSWPDGTYVGIIHPDVKYDLQGDTANWQEILKHTPDYTLVKGGLGMVPGRGGFVGQMFGVKFLMSTQALVDDAAGSYYSGGSADVYDSYIFGPEYFGVSELQGVQTFIKNPHPASDLDMYGSVGWKCAFAVKELESKRMVLLKSRASLWA